MSVQKWNGRAVRGAIVRLEQTGMLKRVRAHKKGARENWLVCVKLLREPNDEDIKNLKFRSQVAEEEPAEEPLLEEDAEGDALMRDIELDMINEVDSENEDGLDDIDRIPPQWKPDRMLANLLFDTIDLTGQDGGDAAALRNRTTGKFWKRPLESLLCRLTDDWEKSQPLHLRHLAVIRDTAVTVEKKFVHYVYRTRGNFQKAVDAGEVSWEGVSKEAAKKSSGEKRGRPKNDVQDSLTLDEWGFSPLNANDFHRRSGLATLSDCRSAIVHRGRHGQHWDNVLTQEMGYQKPMKPHSSLHPIQLPAGTPRTVILSQEEYKAAELKRWQDNANGALQGMSEVAVGAQTPASNADGDNELPSSLPEVPFHKPRPAAAPIPLLTMEQRVALGLPVKGRLSQDIEKQIRAHRRKTGDPTSLPDVIVTKDNPRASQRRVGPVLLSKEERLARGLPAVGRLSKAVEDQIRQERGLAPKHARPRQPRNKNSKEAPLLTIEQRITRGLPPIGRLPQKLVDKPRRKRDIGASLDTEDTEFDPDDNEGDTTMNEDAQSDARLEPEPVESSPFTPSSQQLGDAAPDTSGTAGSPLRRAIVPEKRRFSQIDEYVQQPSKRMAVESGLPERNGSPEETLDFPSIRLPAKRTSEASNIDTPHIAKKPCTHTKPSPPAPVAEGSRSIPVPIVSPNGDGAVLSTEEPVAASGSKPGRTRAHGPPLLADPAPHVPSESESRARQIVTMYKNRTEPGIYINPYATRSSGRGRPRKAFIVTFKSARLQGLEWFRLDPSSPPITRSSTATHPAQNSTSINPYSPQTTRPLSAKPNSGAQGKTVSPPSGIIHHVESSQTEVETSSEGLPRPVTLQEQGKEKVSSLEGQMSKASAEVPPTLDVPMTQHASSPPHPMAPGWNAINAPTLAPSASYQSPYGPSVLAPSSPQSPAPSEGVRGFGDDTPDLMTLPGTPAATEEARDSSAVPEVITVEDEYLSKKQGAFTSRGVVLGKGNIWGHRTRIINDILNRCNGAFPLNGEINPLFEALWAQTVSKKTPVPERSTIVNTIRNLIQDPSQGLKKMTFQIQGITDGLMVKRFILARKHLSPTSPEVVRIRDGMIQCYPNKYYPPEVRDLVQKEPKAPPKPLPEIDETIQMDDLYPPVERRLLQRIRAALRRRDEQSEKKSLKVAEDRKVQNIAAEMALPELRSGSLGGARAKGMRLASLSDARQPSRTDLGQHHALHVDDGSEEEEAERASSPTPSDSSEAVPPSSLHPRVPRGISPALSDSSEDVPLSILRSTAAGPLSGKRTHDNGHQSSGSEPLSDLGVTERQSSTKDAFKDGARLQSSDLTAPAVRFYPNIGVFSTELRPLEDQSGGPGPIPIAAAAKGRKRVRIVEPSTEGPRKRTRLDGREPVAETGDLYVNSGSGDTEESYEETIVPPKRKYMRHKFPQHPTPTLVERLTGLTGDPGAPIYQPPTKKRKTFASWEERKAKDRARIRDRKDNKKYPEVLDPVDKFKEWCCTLVIASSMSSDDGNVDWSIVSKVYGEDRAFDLEKTKKTWSWVQENMATQLSTLTESFQSAFLQAYETGKIASIEEPETYDWASLVQWALRHCKYPELPLPQSRKALQDFVIDISSYEVLDRPVWYRDSLAANGRAKRLLNYAFAAPLHQSDNLTTPAEDSVVKARSWIRANTATPQLLYNGKMAHDKLRTLGDPVLERAVTDFVHASFLRMRKIKRLLPGRNYNFTATSAKHYRRAFELKDFMAAVKLKKDLDTAFADDDPEKRAFNISRTTQDGAVMAVLSLVGDGRIKLIPKLPPVNNEFDASLPRLSVWGFCEGDYIHRTIDRQRLFWPIHAVPTSDYEFGNPLQPAPFPLAPKETGEPADWPRLPDPPLPGRHNPDAPLPIWSNVNGQTVTWPWWNRILNLVLQALMFQPGTSAPEIFRHCPKHTTELFEIELVLEWLEQVKAVKQTPHGTYEVQPGFWAAFGDSLIDEENDWFGEHVKRKRTNTTKLAWRDEYNFRFSTLQAGQNQGPRENVDSDSEGEEVQGGEKTLQERILENSRAQYRVTREALMPLPHTQHDMDSPASRVTSARYAVAAPRTQGPPPPHEMPIDPQLEASPAARDVVMTDAQDIDAEGEDVDAEGEPDDELL